MRLQHSGGGEQAVVNGVDLRDRVLAGGEPACVTEFEGGVDGAAECQHGACHGQRVGVPIPGALFHHAREWEQIITLADQHGLLTQLTLFDGWSSDSDTGRVSQVLAPYASDRRIAGREGRCSAGAGRATMMHCINSHDQVGIARHGRSRRPDRAMASLVDLVLGDTTDVRRGAVSGCDRKTAL